MKRRDFIAIGVASSLLASCKSLGLPGNSNGKQSKRDLEVWWSEGYYPEETDAIETIFANWQRITGNKVNLSFFSENELAAKGVIVVIEAEHTCMTIRGVKKPGALTVTSAVRGLFRNNLGSRAEAMALINGKH